MEEKKYSIALDIDGVIADTMPEFEYRLKQDFKITTDYKTWSTHRVAQQFPEVPESWVDEQLKDPVFWKNAMCIEDAWYMTNKWFMDGNDVFLVTCRGSEAGPQCVEQTLKWLDEWEINYNQLYHSQTRLHKWETCLELGVDFLVEDDPHEVQSSSQHLPCYLRNHNYNQDYDIGNGVRIDSLYELDRLVVNVQV